MASTSTINDNIPPLSPNEETFQLVWHNYQSNFHEVVGDLLSSESFADVSLVAEGRLVRAHRLVLSACSPYLHNVLRALPPAPASHPVVLLPPEVSLATLKSLLDFMYRGVVHVPHAALVAVLHAGDILQVRGLCRGDELQRPPEGSEAADRSSPVSSSPQSNTPCHDTLQNGAPLPPPKRRGRGRFIENGISKGGGHAMDHPLQGTFEPPEEGLQGLLGIQVRVKEEPYDWSIEPPSLPDQFIASPADESAVFRPTVLLSTKTEATSMDSKTASDDDEEPTPLTCEQCHEVFPRAAAWVRHLQIHPPVAQPARPLALPPLLPRPPSIPAPRHTSFSSGGAIRRPHICSHCGKRFSSRASLSIHGRTHTGETPFTCDLCHKGFNVKSNLLRHLRTLHNRIVSPSDVDLSGS